MNRILKPGGIFHNPAGGGRTMTGIGGAAFARHAKTFPGMNLKEQSKKLKESRFDILEQGEAFCPIRF